MKRFTIGLFIGSLLLALFPFLANAQPLENCRIEASNWNAVSLGFPVRTERLAHIRNPKILVLPYQLKGEPKFEITDWHKAKFAEVGKNISQLSNDFSNVNFIFSQTVQLTATAADLDEVKMNVQSTWQKDFDNSTFGFVEKALLEADKFTDYKGIDAVILFGSSASVNQMIAEAMEFTKDLNYKNNAKKANGGNWSDPIKTSEGEINNTILLYNDFTAPTITHEIMHLYGLTDLYGAKTSPPLSLMSDGTKIALLPHELWIIGWLPDSNVTCVSLKNEISQNLKDNRFVLNYSKGHQSLVIPTGSTTALIVDVVIYKQSTYLLYYSLDNEARPAIITFPPVKTLDGSLNITGYAGVSAQLTSPDYTVLISDNDGSSVVINVIPSGKISSEESKQLINLAELKKLENDRLTKAKQEADAKAAVELRAKQEADAKAVAEKAAADLLAQQKAAAIAKAAALKKTTITCIKGKLSKKVTAVKPVCPAGYTKKR